MPVLKSEYREIYEPGSTARKRNYYEEPDRYNSHRRYGKNKTKKSLKISSKNKTLAMICCVLFTFSMALIMSYRYNLINEKNLKTIELKSDLDAVQADLLNAQIAVEQSTNLTEIEAYAKQKLGMQKPDKNQIIYVDTSNVSNNRTINKNSNSISSIIDSIKEKITNLF